MQDWRSELAAPVPPPEPSAWPPSLAAVGLAFLLALVLILAARHLWQRYQRRRWRRAALAELADLDLEATANFSRLLRRVAAQACGPAVAAGGNEAFARELQARSGGRIPAELARDMASCAHRPDGRLDPRQLAAARVFIESLPC